MIICKSEDSKLDLSLAGTRVFWRVVKGLEVRRREKFGMEVVAPQGCRRTNKIAKKRHVFPATITWLETAEEALEAV
jgi:hypothetical protein